MTEKLKLPIGIENFKEMRTKGYYYIDKTGLIQTLLENLGKINLFTRPRRFGKTLNMSMLKYFLGKENDSMLFDGLEISRNQKLCEEYMGNFPVLSITLKGATGENYKEAKTMLRRIIGNEAMQFQFLNAVKEWYDGYHFGNLDIYCPWDVVSYCHALKMNPSITPKNYWVNTSSNQIVKQFISKAKGTTKNEIELLINGGSVKKKIHQELTYRDLYSKMENLWSVLFTTGYLTQSKEEDHELTELIIPNKEIRWIYVEQIQDWFEEETLRDSQKLEAYCHAFEENNVSAIEEGFNAYLRKTISIRDTNTRKEMKENFYHGILLGLLGSMDGWDIQSNAESGEGYSDISIEIAEKEVGIIIELKYAEKAAFDNACQHAIQQINNRNYEETLIDAGMKTIYRYGIACYKKRCKVLSEAFYVDC
ncbi:MAG: ATP-binding protein [Lachnospiraceae bacterium]|nr:ATP-binding protein [Lachnospiraceae bacterium]